MLRSLYSRSQLSSSVSTNLPGHLVPHLTFYTEIWLQWWTHANEQHPNEHVYYWLGVYAALGFFSLLTTFIGTWYDGNIFRSTLEVFFYD